MESCPDSVHTESRRVIVEVAGKRGGKQVLTTADPPPCFCWVGCSLAVHSTGGGRLGTLSDRLCFPGWSWYHSILDCQAGWGSLRFLGRKRIGTYNSQNSFQDVLGPFCIGGLL